MGDYFHQLTVDEMPSHNHDWKIRIQGFNGSWNIESGSGGEVRNNKYMHPEGGDKRHPILNPVIITMMWMRTT